jgi:(1->4)-alpha-D-glucan 1-alpha-D-glucosylmutase
MHGYDVCDPSRINPEIGTESDLEALVRTLHQHGMALVLDIVPNHLAVGGRVNPWWWDVLKFGRSSAFASCFDIDWDSDEPRLRGRILLPVLGDAYENILRKDELKLHFSGDEVTVRYHEQEFPIDPASLPRDRIPVEFIPGSGSNAEQFHALLERQHYRLAHWRDGDAHLNYRRFFTVTHLAGVRVEDPAVFERTHQRVMDWHRRGLISGWRIDHPDGLRDPRGYLERLAKVTPATWTTVEKILGPGEALPSAWPVAGTTGYDYLNRVAMLFVDPAGEEALTSFYGEFTQCPTDYTLVVRDKKTLVLREHLVAEVSRLVRMIEPIAAAAEPTRRLEGNDLRAGLIEFTACLPVYRTYVDAAAGVIADSDREHIEAAHHAARRQAPQLEAFFDLLHEVLLLRHRSPGSEEFVMRFQQLTGPAMAKGVEDTAFYCFNRLVALNEVGGDPGQFGCGLEVYHQSCLDAQRQWPHAMLATSTHDTKRSEDVRARLWTLSEIPAAWTAAVKRWSLWNERHRSGKYPDRNAEYLFYQTAVGAWPISPERMSAYMEKAAREAKEHTHWTEPNCDYEEALKGFVSRTMADAAFGADLEQFVADLVEPGHINSLSQTLLKLTSPGIPDIYQGTELWDFSLVDPDNRRPVDFAERQRLLAGMDKLGAEAVWARRAEGLPRLWLIQKTLSCRREYGHCFDASAGYEPLRAEGPKASHAISYRRGDGVIVIAPRMVLALRRDWTDTHLALPAGPWRNEFTGELFPGGQTRLSALLRSFPVALLCRS